MGTVCAKCKKCPEPADQRVRAPSPIAVAPAYHRHRPERTALYAIVAEHYPRFVHEIERGDGHLPQFVRRAFEDYLKCGLLEHGFLRVKCDGCRHEHLVAFSCKRRGFCPSCWARRMVESAAHLVDHVFPEAPVRQRRLRRHGGLRAAQEALPACRLRVRTDFPDAASILPTVTLFVSQFARLDATAG
jgi:ribosomal protein S27E